MTITEHGERREERDDRMRLIDADAFIHEIRKTYCEDCARRKGIKNGKMRFCYEIGGVPCRACDIEDVLDALDDYAPTVQPEPHWIPCSDRLPKISEDVLLNYFDEVTIGWLNSDGSWSIFDGQECVSADEISAWMPLPEPWKGE